ncbi:MAG TPA: hypothetical protein VGC41_25280, partial [Kofleriaceae bacterium]
MNHVLVLLLIASAGACKKEAASSTSGPGSGSAVATNDCAAVIGDAIDKNAREGVSNGAGTQAPSDEIKKMQADVIKSLEPVKQATIKACVDDSWPAEVLTCMKSKGAITECDKLLSPAQIAHREQLAKAATTQQNANAPKYCDKYA